MRLIFKNLGRLIELKGDAFIDQATLNATTNKVIEACDSIDGVRDGLIENPLLCQFDVNTLACPPLADLDNHNQTCLSPEQIMSLKLIYNGPKNLRTGAALYPGFEFGSERELLLQETSLYLEYAAPLLQNLVFHDVSYDVETFDFDKDVTKVKNAASSLIDEIAHNFDDFQSRGGKMIVTQGKC